MSHVRVCEVFIVITLQIMAGPGIVSTDMGLWDMGREREREVETETG